jgi:hypothetical protein
MGEYMAGRVRVEPYTDDRWSAWNAFVAASNNGTIFHRLDFLSYHPKDRFNERHLMFYEEDRLIAVMPMALFDEDGVSTVRTPYGGSHGGIVTKHNLRYVHYQGLMEAFLKYCSRIGVQRVHFSPVPFHYYDEYTCYLEYTLSLFGFRLVRRDVLSVIPLGEREDDIMPMIRRKARSDIRRAIRDGVTVSESRDFATFFGMLVESKRKHGAAPTHSLDELRRIDVLCPSRLKLDLAFLDREPIAGVLYFICNSRVVLTFYTCYREGYQQYNGVSCLIYEGMKWAVRKGYRYYDWGSTAEMKKADLNLFRFKEGFGAVGYCRDFFCLEV